MTTVTTAIPDDLHFHQGEEIQLQALVQADGSFLVTSVLRHQPPKAPALQAPVSGKPMTLTGWARKWAGTMKLEEGETRASLRDDYLKKKFGA